MYLNVCVGHVQFFMNADQSLFLSLCDFRYESGDHVAVFPTNDSDLVNRLGEVLGVDLDVVISLNNLDGIALTTQSTLTSPARPSNNLPPPTFILCSVSSLNASDLDFVISLTSRGISVLCA